MRPPPKYSPPKSLDLQWAADPFDPRFVRNTAARELTPLGLLLEIWGWVKRHPDSVPDSLTPAIRSVEDCLRREAPDALEFLEKMQ